MQKLLRTLEFAHMTVGRFVKSGDSVIDATAGNGNDTLFLARLVGEKGRVFAFDVQEKAIINTKNLLQQNGLISRAQLIKDGHEHIEKYIGEEVSAVMFNLGYLPGGDHSIVTRPNHTIGGVEASLNLLSSEGVITLVVYTGHPGGQEEWNYLEKYVKNLNKKKYRVLLYKFLNTKESPFLVAVEKL